MSAAAPYARHSAFSGTASQRAKLQALALRNKQKREREEKEEAKPKIRNYNIKDDQEPSTN